MVESPKSPQATQSSVYNSYHQKVYLNVWHKSLLLQFEAIIVIPPIVNMKKKKNHFFLTRRTPLTTCLKIISINFRVFQIAMQFSNAIIINAKIAMQLLSNCNAIQLRKTRKQTAPTLIGTKHDLSFRVKKCFHAQKLSLIDVTNSHYSVTSASISL